MTTVLELEGTWEEIKAQFPDFNGQKLHVTVKTVETAPAPNGTAPLKNGTESEPDLSNLPNAVQRMIAWADSIPLEERAKLPTDLAEQHDHYIYGSPKK